MQTGPSISIRWLTTPGSGSNVDLYGLGILAIYLGSQRTIQSNWYVYHVWDIGTSQAQDRSGRVRDLQIRLTSLPPDSLVIWSNRLSTLYVRSLTTETSPSVQESSPLSYIHNPLMKECVGWSLLTMTAARTQTAAIACCTTEDVIFIYCNHSKAPRYELG